MIVEAKGLTKTFLRARSEPFTAVSGVDFTIDAGERVAFIGPNGAGKSTTLKMLTGLLYPSAGAARVAGFVPWAERRRLAYEIGIVFGQRSQLWYHLRVRDSFDHIWCPGTARSRLNAYSIREAEVRQDVAQNTCAAAEMNSTTVAMSLPSDEVKM